MIAPELPAPTSHDVIRKHLRINGITDPTWTNIGGRIGDAIAGAFAELHPEVALLREMAVLDLRPGDILVLTANQSLSSEEVDHLDARMKERFPDNKITLLDGGLKLAVVRPGEVDPA